MRLIKIPLLERPYRSCVGLMVFNKKGKVFCGQRLDNKAEAWQLPQGGIDDEELPIEAGFRELKKKLVLLMLSSLVNTQNGYIMTYLFHWQITYGRVNIEVKNKDGFYFIF